MVFQGLLDRPRNNEFIFQGEVQSLLTSGEAVEVGYGLEMHWPTSVIQPADPLSVFDISSIIMDGSTVSYDNTAKIGGTANLVLDPNAWEALGGNSLIQPYASPSDPLPSPSHALYWGNPRTRLRVYQTLTMPGIGTAKFYQGVYLPATPQAPMDTTDPIYSVTCYDLTSLFDIPIPFDVTYPAGTNPIFACSSIITSVANNMGGYAPWTWINYTNKSSTLNISLSWVADGSTTWLDIMNALLAAIGYYPLYADCYGTIQMQPWIDPRVAPIDWTFDLTDPNQNIVDPTGTWSPDMYQVPNKWVFILQGSTSTPVEGNGQYTLINQNSGPSSINRQLGRVQLSYHSLNATGQADLVTQGNAIMVQESSLNETFSINTSPLPLAAHADVVNFICDTIEPNMFAAAGPSSTRRCAVQSWELPLNGDPMSWTLATVG